MGDPESRQGLAHFLEHMLFLGTRKFPEKEYGTLRQTVVTVMPTPQVISQTTTFRSTMMPLKEL